MIPKLLPHLLFFLYLDISLLWAILILRIRKEKEIKEDYCEEYIRMDFNK